MFDYDKVDGGGDCSSDFDMTFQVSHWCSKYYLSAKTVAFDDASEADHQKLVFIALDWGSTLL